MNRNIITKILRAYLAYSLVLIGGCVSPPRTERDVAIEAAKQEARKRGWDRVKVYSTRYVDGRWVVCIIRRPTKVIESEAIVDVGIDGQVIDFRINQK